MKIKFSFHYLLLMLLMVFSVGERAFAAPVNVTGTVFYDYNATGIREVAATRTDYNEPGAAGVTVMAYGADNVLVATTTTAADGSYVLSFDNALHPRVRVEFTNLPGASLEAGAFGANSGTSVQFVDVSAGDAANVNYGINRPVDYCQSAAILDLVTTCVTQSDISTVPLSNMRSVFSMPYTINYSSPGLTTGSFAPGTQEIASQVDTGSVYGLAFQRPTATNPDGTIYVGAFARRLVFYNTSGSPLDAAGAIYAVDPLGGTPTLFATIPNARENDGLAYTRDNFNDTYFYNRVSKEGLGDLEISEDQTTLYTVNLYDRQLYSVDLASGAVNALGVIGNPTCVDGVYRPFGLGVRDGLVYVGGVCTGENSNPAGNTFGRTDTISAHVFTYNPVGGAISEVLSFPLNYPRGCANGTHFVAGGTRSHCIDLGGGGPEDNKYGYDADWQPWYDRWMFPELAVPNGSGTGTANAPFSFAQPILSDITFVGDDMVIGLRDRTGDQLGFNDVGPGASLDFPTNRLYTLMGAGDVLRAAPDGGGGWQLENNATVSGLTSAGAGNMEGPGNGEFYYQDNYYSLPNLGHDEVSYGAVLHIAGQPQLVSNGYDAHRVNEAGIRWYNNTDGLYDRGASLRGTAGVAFFGKAGGLGDLAALCNNAPIEIGNFVWADLNRNGIQDPDEPMFAGVTVELVDSGGAVIDTAVTDANGQYIFSSDSISNHAPNDPNAYRYDVGIQYNQTYTVRIPLDPAVNPPLAGYFVTAANTGSPINDSNGVMDPTRAYSQTTVTTGTAGQNNHTLDFGFSLQRPDDPPDDPNDPNDPPDQGVSIDKTVNPPFAMPNDAVDWVLVVRNATDQAVNDVLVSDNLPSQLEYRSSTISPNIGSLDVTGQSFRYSIGTLNAGQSVQITLHTRIRPEVNLPFVIVNGASVYVSDTLSDYDDDKVVGAGQLPNTGELPLWRDYLVMSASGAASVLSVGLFMVRRRRQ